MSFDPTMELEDPDEALAKAPSPRPTPDASAMYQDDGASDRRVREGGLKNG